MICSGDVALWAVRSVPMVMMNPQFVTQKSAEKSHSAPPRTCLFTKMFSRLTRFPLRRCLHTQASSVASGSSLRRLGIAAGGASVVASYITWRLTSEHNRIALDSSQSLPRKYHKSLITSISL